MVNQSGNNKDTDFEEALRQFVDAQWRDQEPDIDEFVKKYPEFEHQIRQKVRSFKKIDALFDSLVQADNSDFDDTVAGQDLVGKKIGSFEIIEMIGRGGMGVVYLAHDTKLKRSVAIKSMPAQLAEDSTARMRFRREAELLASLNHSNIAVIYEIIEQVEDPGYLVLEYVPGETLAERIAREPLKLEEILSIGQQIAEAVSAAHKKGVIHRDIKPGNIKLTPEGRIKVLDFGLAKHSVSEDEKSHVTTTEPGRVIGTPVYMSPEQARGKATDHRTDIWSFGCIMYEMLTGQLPFEGETATDTLARIIERQPDWEALPQQTPENIRVLIHRCLEKDLDQRLVNITEASIEIREALSKPVVTPLVPISTKSRRMIMIVCISIIAILSAIAVWNRLNHEEIRLVVLPFENLGPAVEEWFADGITDEITTRLVGIHGLGVISRHSAMQYKNKEKSAPQIAKELDVDYILEGTIQSKRPSDPNSSVRIRLQLIRASDDTHIWAQAYDNNLRDVLLQLQSNVAEQIVQALDITLLEPERQVLVFSPTNNSLAYEYYLRGNEYFHRRLLDNDFETAIKMYEKAVELDPGFALAYTQLSRSHVYMYWFNHDHRKERLAMAEDAVKKAFELNPNLSEAHVSLGYYYYHGYRDYGRALKQFTIARKSQLNNGVLLAGIGFVKRRQGKFEQALPYIKEASELDPLSRFMAQEVGRTFSILGKFSEAESYYQQAISLAPDLPISYVNLAWLYVHWHGNTKKAREILKEAIQNSQAAQKPTFVGSLIGFDVLDGKYQDALDRISSNSGDIDDMDLNTALQHGLLYRYMNKEALSKKYYDRARSILESKISERTDDTGLHGWLGVVYAGLGRKEEAIQKGKLHVKLLPVSKDAMEGPIRIKDLARIYVMVGEYDLAFDQLELLKRPIAGGYKIGGNLSITQLRLDPDWEPLRNYPRFKKLIESTK